MLSIHNAPLWPVSKPDQTWRLTVDYRALNARTTPEALVIAKYKEVVTAAAPGSC